MSSQFMGVFSIGQTIDRGIKLYKLSIGRIFLLLLIPNFLVMTPNLISSSFSSVVASNPGKMVGLAGGYGVLFIASFFLYMWASIVMVRYLYSLTTDEPVTSFGQMLGLGQPKDFLFFITGIIWMATLVVATLLLIVPGLYLANLMYLLAAPICIVEQRYFFSGIGRMVNLAQKRWWKTSVINLVTFLIMFVPILASYGFFVWAMIQGRTVFDGTANTEAMTRGGFSVMALIALLVYSAVCALVYPLYASVGIVHYNSLRSEKESTDIAAQLDSIAPAQK